MAVYIDIEQQDLPKNYQKYKLISSKDGKSQSVYFLDNKYILKIFNTYTKEEYLNEKNLLKYLYVVSNSQIIDTFYINNNFCIVYNQIIGISNKQSEEYHIVQIGIFLKKMHKLTQNKTSSNKDIFSTKYLEEMLYNSNNKKLYNIYKDTTICLKNNGIIHGDLFQDNCKFYNNKLSGVYDFCESCNGDFIFDLAVIAMSWCYDKNTINNKKILLLMKAYNLDISLKEFKKYIKYALLYYTVSRYINKRNYKELYYKLLLI